MASSELKPVDILVDYDFLLPLNSGYGIVTFKWFYQNEDFERCITQINSFDWAERLIGSEDNLNFHIQQEKVSECGPNEFVLCDGPRYAQLRVYDSSLTCLRKAECRNLSTICCNSEFVFGLWDANDEQNDDYESDLGDYDEDDSDEQEEPCSSRRIQACHLDTLKTAFHLLVPKKYTIERIVADKHHLVAMSRLSDEPDESRQWFMIIFDLQEASVEKNGNKTARKFLLVERLIDLTIEPL